ncbi:NAD(P)H-binding protein [Streptomyces sp. NPDC048514]|uniref:NAD(P)H-binding protein n=1 Tax=Streptomyces sp. NPDC048514 TaxID=3365564 RepID=UPI0037155B6C
MILVTGATGHVGRPLVDLLLEAGAGVRALTRNPELARLPEGVEVARTDELPMKGIESVFFVLAAFPDGPAEVIRRAREHGVRRIVALSSYSARDDDPKNSIAVRHRDLERQIEESGLEWTALQPAGGLAVTALEWSRPIRTTGVVRGPFARAHSAPVHEQDIAELAARALLTDELLGAKPMFSGPESITYADRARLIGEAIGKPVRFEEISHDETRREMAEVGVPPAAVEARLRMFAALVDRPHEISPVEPYLGRPARGFAEWAADHIADFT